MLSPLLQGTWGCKQRWYLWICYEQNQDSLSHTLEEEKEVLSHLLVHLHISVDPTLLVGPRALFIFRAFFLLPFYGKWCNTHSRMTFLDVCHIFAPYRWTCSISSIPAHSHKKSYSTCCTDSRLAKWLSGQPAVQGLQYSWLQIQNSYQRTTYPSTWCQQVGNESRSCLILS